MLGAHKTGPGRCGKWRLIWSAKAPRPVTRTWCRPRLPLEGNDHGGRGCHDDVGLQADQLLREGSYPIDRRVNSRHNCINPHEIRTSRIFPALKLASRVMVGVTEPERAAPCPSGRVQGIPTPTHGRRESPRMDGPKREGGLPAPIRTRPERMAHLRSRFTHPLAALRSAGPCPEPGLRLTASYRAVKITAKPPFSP